MVILSILAMGHPMGMSDQQLKKFFDELDVEQCPVGKNTIVFTIV